MNSDKNEQNSSCKNETILPREDGRNYSEGSKSTAPPVNPGEQSPLKDSISEGNPFNPNPSAELQPPASNDQKVKDSN